MDALRRHSDLIKKEALILAIIALLIYTIYSYISWSEANNIIHDPTFVGVVIGKETVVERLGITPKPGITIRRLHVVGEYIRDDVVIQVDRVFTVSEEMFYRFEVDDLILHEHE